MGKDFIYPPFVVIDLETTGFSPTQDEVIEYGAIKVGENWEIEDVFSALAWPMAKEIPEHICKLTGITYEMLKEENADLTYFTMDAFLQFIGDLPVIGHNVAFDIGFLDAAISLRFPEDRRTLGNQRVDTLYMARRILPGLYSYKLESLAKYMGVKDAGFHRALADAEKTFFIYKKLFELQKEKGVGM